jgi:hypothetical protein
MTDRIVARLDLVEIFRLDGKVAVLNGASYGLVPARRTVRRATTPPRVA